MIEVCHCHCYFLLLVRQHPLSTYGVIKEKPFKSVRFNIKRINAYACREGRGVYDLTFFCGRT